MGVIKLKPVFKENIWGGQRLHRDFSYPIPEGKFGECWGISAHKHGDCEVISGAYLGMHLAELWEMHPEAFGFYPSNVYPLLVKIIDAEEDLSIQVHPDDAYAGAKEDGSKGKNECWYILDCKADAEIIIGHHAKDDRELQHMIREQRWDQLLRRVFIKPGDFFQIDAGCIHAIKGGTLILEIQQNSDITYRVYDYGRLTDGKPRELHLEKSLDVIRVPYVEAKTDRFEEKLPGAHHVHLFHGPCYSVDKFHISGSFQLKNHRFFQQVSVIEGSGTVDGIEIKKGSHFIISSGVGYCTFNGDISIICSTPENCSL